MPKSATTIRSYTCSSYNEQNKDNATPTPARENYARGRINHIAIEEARNAPDVVIGMFLVNSHPTTVLFDSGASHCFISSNYVAKYSLPISLMKNGVLVSSLGGEMKANFACHNLAISIKGVEFSVHLIVLDSKRVDLVLGMDWLSKHKGVLDCAIKAVNLTTKDRTILEYAS